MVTRYGTFVVFPGWADESRFGRVAQRLFSNDSSPVSTFSDFGQTRPVELIRGNFSSDVWFNPKLSNHYRPEYGRGDPAFRVEDYVTYLYRKDGVTEERLEPVERIEPHPDLVEEWLYIHWQEAKRKGKWPNEAAFGYRWCTDLADLRHRLVQANSPRSREIRRVALPHRRSRGRRVQGDTSPDSTIQDDIHMNHRIHRKLGCWDAKRVNQRNFRLGVSIKPDSEGLVVEFARTCTRNCSPTITRKGRHELSVPSAIGDNPLRSPFVLSAIRPSTSSWPNPIPRRQPSCPNF